VTDVIDEDAVAETAFSYGANEAGLLQEGKKTLELKSPQFLIIFSAGYPDILIHTLAEGSS
jgi:hypothetical protein